MFTRNVRTGRIQIPSCENGREKSGHIADDAAAEGDQDRAAVGAGGRELLRQPLQRRQPLVVLACGQQQDGWTSVSGEAAQKNLRPQGPDLWRGHYEVAARPLTKDVAEVLRQIGQQVLAQQHVVRG